MSELFKRGSIWHFDFQFQKKRYQGSTFCKNHEAAKKFVAKVRTNLALGLVGLVHRDPPPILSEFLEGKFLESVRQNSENENTQEFYEMRVNRLCAYVPFTQLRLDAIDELAMQAYKDSRLKEQLSRSTINNELRTLRKAMIFADLCGLVRYKKVRTLPGEKNRDFVLDGELENRYLALAGYPLREAAILMLDLGLRPGEVVALKKTDVTDEAVTVSKGKTPNARRSLPQTARTRDVFALCSALYPNSPWIFPGRKSHRTLASIDAKHDALRLEHDLPEEFVLHSCRHTFATRLAESSGGDLFALKKALGHASVKTCEKYVHPSAKHLTVALKQKELLDRMIRGEIVTTEITTERKN